MPLGTRVNFKFEARSSIQRMPHANANANANANYEPIACVVFPSYGRAASSWAQVAL